MTTWPSIKLGDVATIDRDGVAPSDIKDGTLYVGLEHIESGGRLLNKHSVSAGELASTKFRFTPGHLLYGKLRPYLAKIAMPDFHGICSTDILPISPGSRLDRAFLAYFLRQPHMVDYASSRSEGANLPRLSPKALAEFEVPLPPVREQRRIAAVLDQANELRRKGRAALSQVTELPQALFSEMFCGPGRFPQRSIESVCDLVTDGTHYTPTYVDNGVLFLSAKNVTSGYINWNDVKYIPEPLHRDLQKRVSPRVGDILLAKNGTTGVSAIVDRDIVFDIYVSLALLRPGNTILSAYLQQAVSSPLCRRQFTGALKGIGVSNLHLVDIRRTQIPLPPLAIQEEFVSRLNAMGHLRSGQIQRLVKFDALFASLQHRAFSGELTSKQAERELAMVG